MAINGYYGGNNDNVTDAGSNTGWADQSGQHYGQAIAGRRAYCFGPTINNYGTWGQMTYDAPVNRGAADLGNPSGLNGVMPGGAAPDGSAWVQGHLVNGESGGVGSIACNLTPISHNINMLHRGWEAVLQILVNAGPVANSIVTYFNPNGLANCRLIYRTHALPPPAGAAPILGPHPLPNVPNGVAVSLGVVINNVLQTGLQVTNEFGTPYSVASWFHQSYYTSQGASHRAKIITMVGGVAISYP